MRAAPSCCRAGSTRIAISTSRPATSRSWPTTSLSGTRSAACGGTTTLMPFAAQMKGQSLREAVADYHRRAEGKAYRRLRVPPHRHRSDAAGPGPGAARAHPRRLHLVQDLHDLRRAEAERSPDPRRARAGTQRARAGHDPCRKRRLHRLADGAGSSARATSRRGSTPPPGRRSPSARPPIARSPWRSSPTRRS